MYMYILYIESFCTYSERRILISLEKGETILPFMQIALNLVR